MSTPENTAGTERGESVASEPDIFVLDDLETLQVPLDDASDSEDDTFYRLEGRVLDDTERAEATQNSSDHDFAEEPAEEAPNEANPNMRDDTPWVSDPTPLDLPFPQMNHKEVFRRYFEQQAPNGVSLTIRKTNQNRAGDTRPKHTVYIACNRHRHRFELQTTRKRRIRAVTAPEADEPLCPWEIVVTAKVTKRKFGKKWTLEVVNSTHNHPPVMNLALLPAVRRKQLEKLLPQCDNDSARNSTPYDFLAQLEDKFGAVHAIAKDIYNLRAKQESIRLEGRDPVSATIEDMKSSPIWTCAHYPRDGPLERLFFAHVSSLQLFQRSNSVVFMDGTFLVERYRMSLLNIVARSNTGHTYSVAYCFLRHTTERDYTWVLKQLKRMYETLCGSEGPETVFTDKEYALLSAIGNVFPHTNNVICAWHISQAIKTHAGPYRAEMTSHFEKMRRCTTVEAYLLAYDEFNDRFEGRGSLREYFRKNWHSCREKWSLAWTSRYLTFSYCATSIAESNHSAIKRTSPGTGTKRSLHKFVNSLARYNQRTCLKVNAAIERAINSASTQRLNAARDYPKYHHIAHDLFGVVNITAIYRALDLITDNDNLTWAEIIEKCPCFTAHWADPTAPAQEVCKYQQHYGTPCLFTIKSCLDDGKSLQSSGFHRSLRYSRKQILRQVMKCVPIPTEPLPARERDNNRPTTGFGRYVPGIELHKPMEFKHRYCQLRQSYANLSANDNNTKQHEDTVWGDQHRAHLNHAKVAGFVVLEDNSFYLETSLMDAVTGEKSLMCLHVDCDVLYLLSAVGSRYKCFCEQHWHQSKPKIDVARQRALKRHKLYPLMFLQAMYGTL